MHPTSAAALWKQALEAQENAKALEDKSKTLAAQATAALEKEAADLARNYRHFKDLGTQRRLKFDGTKRPR